jgi:prepilin-type N-terminal cleavage/methylation domain-containing protein
MISPRPFLSRAAFSLVELLAVLAIVALLMSMLAPAVTGMGKARELDTRSFQVGELVQMARQNAMTKNAMTALVIPLDPALSANGRLVALFELSSSTTPKAWRQVSRWTELGDSVVIMDCVDSAPALTTPLPAMEHAGQKISTWKTLIFLPDGSLLNAQASMRLASGYYPSNTATPVFTGKMRSESQPVDVCEITILPATGKVKIDRL